MSRSPTTKIERLFRSREYTVKHREKKSRMGRPFKNRKNYDEDAWVVRRMIKMVEQDPDRSREWKEPIIRSLRLVYRSFLDDDVVALTDVKKIQCPKCKQMIRQDQTVLHRC